MKNKSSEGKGIKINYGELYLTIEGEGTCDWCGKEIKEIIHTEQSGDFCRKCFNIAKRNAKALSIK